MGAGAGRTAGLEPGALWGVQVAARRGPLPDSSATRDPQCHQSRIAIVHTASQGLCHRSAAGCPCSSAVLRWAEPLNIFQVFCKNSTCNELPYVLDILPTQSQALPGMSHMQTYYYFSVLTTQTNVKQQHAAPHMTTICCHTFCTAGQK